MHKIESFVAKLALTIVGVSIVFITIEAVANYWLWNIASLDDFNLYASINQVKERYGDDFFSKRLDKRDGFSLQLSAHPYLGHIPSRNYVSGNNKHNELGFRGESITVEKPDGVYRIVAVGGSTTYSIDVEDFRDSYPVLLERRLHDSGYEEVEVVNAGASSYSSWQNLINIEFRVLPLEPDLIIIYQGFNDIGSRLVYPYSQYLGDNSGSSARDLANTVMLDIWEYSTAIRMFGIRFGYFASHAALELYFNTSAPSDHRLTFFRQFNRGTYPSGIFQEVSAMEMLRNNPPVHFERNLLSMLAVAERHNAEVLLVTVTTSSDFHQRTNTSKNRFFSSTEFSTAMAQHNDVTRRIAASTRTPLFDLAAAFPDDPALFTDGLHMNAEGNRVRAKLIGDFVISEFLAPD